MDEKTIRCKVVRRGFIKRCPSDPSGPVMVEPGEIIEVYPSAFSDSRKVLPSGETGWMERLDGDDEVAPPAPEVEPKKEPEAVAAGGAEASAPRTRGSSKRPF